MSFYPQIIGSGIYSMRDAAALTQSDLWALRHWIRGDLRTAHSRGRNPTPPIISLDYAREWSQYYLSFLDLIEVRVIQLLKQEGVSIHSIRYAHGELKHQFNQSHPFALNRLWTDGKGIWIRIGKEREDKRLLHIVTRQYELDRIIMPFLKFIDFDAGGLAARWWPFKGRRSIVIDPERQFGRPITSREGVPTIVLALSYRNEKSISKVSEWYKVRPDTVRDSVVYESQHTKRVYQKAA